MVTDVIRPSGSKMLEVHFKISCFIAINVNMVVSGLGEAHTVSV